jgi:hypothetical protein
MVPQRSCVLDRILNLVLSKILEAWKPVIPIIINNLTCKLILISQIMHNFPLSFPPFLSDKISPCSLG